MYDWKKTTVLFICIHKWLKWDWCYLSLCCFCLFVWGFSSHWLILHSYWDVTNTGKGLQELTYARHLWSLSSDGYLACYIYCATKHPFNMVISDNLWPSHLLPSVQQWSCPYLFYRLRSVAALIRTSNLPNASWML